MNALTESDHYRLLVYGAARLRYCQRCCCLPRHPSPLPRTASISPVQTYPISQLVELRMSYSQAKIPGASRRHLGVAGTEPLAQQAQALAPSTAPFLTYLRPCHLRWRIYQTLTPARACLHHQLSVQQIPRPRRALARRQVIPTPHHTTSFPPPFVLSPPLTSFCKSELSCSLYSVDA